MINTFFQKFHRNQNQPGIAKISVALSIQIIRKLKLPDFIFLARKLSFGMMNPKHSIFWNWSKSTMHFFLATESTWTTKVMVTRFVSVIKLKKSYWNRTQPKLDELQSCDRMECFCIQNICGLCTFFCSIVYYSTFVLLCGPNSHIALTSVAMQTLAWSV